MEGTPKKIPEVRSDKKWSSRVKKKELESNRLERDKWILGDENQKTIQECFEDWCDRHQWTAITLGLCAFVGVVAVGIFAPNVLQIFGKKKIKISKKEIATAHSRLVRKGLIIIRQNQYQLTRKGERKLNEFLLATCTHHKKPRWDNQWRFLLYDVSEKFHGSRDRIRKIIKLFGFYQFQKNVWVYPHPDARLCLKYLQRTFGKDAAKMVLLSVPRFPEDQELTENFKL